MFRVILLILLLAAGMVVGPILAGNKGYVMIAMGNYTIEMTVVSATLMAVGFYFALLVLESLLGRLFSLSGVTRSWLGHRRLEKARHRTLQGTLALAEGQFRQAEKLMIKGARDTDTPLLNYLSAAEAAQAQGLEERREDYLRQAESEHPQAGLAVGLIRARLQLRQGEYEQAEATLEALRAQYPQNLVLLTLQKECYLALKRWSALLKLLPLLQKKKLVDAEELSRLQKEIYPALFAEQGASLGQDGLLQLWRELPKGLRQDPLLLAALCRQLMALDEHARAEELLLEGLRRQAHPDLLALCAQLVLGDYGPLLTLLQRLESANPDLPPLLSALGQLNLHQGHLAQAQTYLERAVALSSKREDYAALARVMEQQRLFEKANHYYRLSLETPAG